MSVTFNLRNDTSLFIKVNGIEDVIVPNTPLEDKTIQWFANENKIIEFFPTIECLGTPLGVGNITFITNDGLYVNRGDFGAQVVKMQADVNSISNYYFQETNQPEHKLLEWSEITDETVVNISFWNL